MSVAPRVAVYEDHVLMQWPERHHWRKVRFPYGFIESYDPQHDNPQVCFRNGGEHSQEARFPQSVSAVLVGLRASICEDE